MYFVARAIAGAVFFETGSAKTTAFSTRAPSCILTFEVCFVLVILIIFSGGMQYLSLSKVVCKRLLSEFKFRSCFGYNSLDKGQRRLPDPPANIIPYILTPLIIIISYKNIIL